MKDIIEHWLIIIRGLLQMAFEELGYRFHPSDPRWWEELGWS